MKRPFLVWLAFAACALVGCGVLAWFTREMLRLDHESAEARRLAAVEENIRLALWRMDSALASVHGLEAVRPAQEYAPFFPADAAYSSNLTPLPGGTVQLPSPLLGYTPPFVKLHFQIEADATIVSPQAPAPALRLAALAAGVPADTLDLATTTLAELRVRLGSTDLAANLPPAPTAPFTAQALDSNAKKDGTLLSSLFARTGEQRAAGSADDAKLNRGDSSVESTLVPETATVPAPNVVAPRDEAQVQQLKSEAEQVARSETLLQSNYNGAELSDTRLRKIAPPAGRGYDVARQQAPVVADASPPSSFSSRRESDAPTPLTVPSPGLEVAEGFRAKEQSDQPPAATAGGIIGGFAITDQVPGNQDATSAEVLKRGGGAIIADELAVGTDEPASPPSTAPTVAAAISENEKQSGAVSDGAASAPPATTQADASGEGPFSGDAAIAAAPASTTITGGSSEGPLQAVWAGDELVFARRAFVDGRPVVQGAWLDWPELEAWLLSRVSDLLPQARLEPALPGTATTALDAARRLAFLPVQLVPGSLYVNGRGLASPLRISIGLAWTGAIVGLAALALLLRGTVRLSERRGAFVSAVTHELRTPLTTFRMYTEMLSSGMVTDETKRRGYVDTLHKESERLSHLVENVLSYARLERGRAAARVEDTTPAALLQRIEERLRQRAQQGGLAVRVEFTGGTGEIPLRTDTTAVEQVLFNLVDNATKYGRPKPVAGLGEAGPGSTTPATAQASNGAVTISVARQDPGRLAIRVVDQGPGLTAAARKRLFQPFSKSATEAAHSQPGVGLGLALCRRLARDELHGDLVLERTGPDGTVFRLELPLS